MTLYSIYIFNRYGDNIFYKEWNRTTAPQEGEAGLVAGFIYTLQHFSSQLSSSGEGGFYAVRTPLYKLHYNETMTGYRVALLSDKDLKTDVVQNILRKMFSDVFQRYVAKDPNYSHTQGRVITSTAFGEALDQFFHSQKIL
ncbi:Sybindin-like family, putative [Trypanosoma equiperdum]|uniref:Trafficking protein particle complex subunit n=1 Tax=Trypanosoma equiperdum TaxID=5694 RepID=A0A1G4HYH3_TRYEQ|nr:Sybindin-like family, putative [Trypanosoma equiperdum]